MEHPREAYRSAYRNIRIAQRKKGQRPQCYEAVDKRPLKERLMHKNKLNEVIREYVTRIWSERTESERAAIGQKISVSAKRRMGEKTLEERRKITEKARSCINHEKQARAASKGLKNWWAKLRENPEEYREYILQNLFRNSLPDLLEEARSLVKAGEYDAVAMAYESVPEVLAQCVRTAFVPAEGMKFIVADFSSIEAQVLAWLAGEQWKTEAFREGKNIYCETASRMFHVKVEKHGENAEYRQRVKQAELACSYGRSVGALKAMGALEAGMKKDELQPLVEALRRANPHIVQLWKDAKESAKTAVKERTTVKTYGLEFTYRGGMLYIRLPSGRKLSYVKPRIGENRYGGEGLTCMGNDITRHWTRIETFGGKVVENLVQGISINALYGYWRGKHMPTVKGYNALAEVSRWEKLLKPEKRKPAKKAVKYEFEEGHTYRIYDSLNAKKQENDISVFRYEGKQGIHYCLREVREGWTQTYTDAQLVGKHIKEERRMIETAKDVYELAVLKGKRLAVTLDKVYRRYTGFGALEVAELELTAKELGEYFGHTEQEVNEILAGAGFQHKINGKWEALPLGEKYALERD